ncbi:MAG: hypothetical protein ACI837_002276 [Crocinitomicaceae bacterium]|jgi:hypothetical protein
MGQNIFKNKYINELASRTLLIPENLVGDEDRPKIEKMYDYDIEFVPQSKIDEMIAAKDEKYAYFTIIEEVVNVHVQYICNVEDSKILAHQHKMVQFKKTLVKGEKNFYLEASGFKKLTSKLK